MRTFGDIFDAFGGPANLGRAIGVTTEHASLMKQRNSIAPGHWPKLIEAAKERGIDWIDWQALAEIAASRRPVSTAEAAE